MRLSTGSKQPCSPQHRHGLRGRPGLLRHLVQRRPDEHTQPQGHSISLPLKFLIDPPCPDLIFKPRRTPRTLHPHLCLPPFTQLALPLQSIATEEGAIRLTNFYSGATCTPSRAMLMTGKFAIHIGMQVSRQPPTWPPRHNTCTQLIRIPNDVIHQSHSCSHVCGLSHEFTLVD